jgi:hypothetical protein
MPRAMLMTECKRAADDRAFHGSLVKLVKKEVPLESSLSGRPIGQAGEKLARLPRTTSTEKHDGTLCAYEVRHEQSAVNY